MEFDTRSREFEDSKVADLFLKVMTPDLPENNDIVLLLAYVPSLLNKT